MMKSLNRKSNGLKKKIKQIIFTTRIMSGSGRREQLKAFLEEPHHMPTKCSCSEEVCWRWVDRERLTVLCWTTVTHPFVPPIILQHILYCIIDSGCTSHDVLQSYFDLLGELMKFNIDAFKRFNKYVNTEEKVCNQTCPDPQTPVHEISQLSFSFRHSWPRSTALWLTRTCWCDASSFLWTALRVRPKTWKVWMSFQIYSCAYKTRILSNVSLSVVEVFSECRLLSYMAQVENRLAFLFRLVNIVNVQTLTQARYKSFCSGFDKIRWITLTLFSTDHRRTWAV